MADGRISPYVITSWMNDLAARTKYLALMSADPYGVSDPLTVEVLGGVYVREAPVFVRTSYNLLTLDEVVVWHALAPGTRVAAVACFDAAFNGNMLAADVLDVHIDYPSGGTYVLPADEFYLGIDVAGT
jgi:hypothetical protein